MHAADGWRGYPIAVQLVLIFIEASKVSQSLGQVSLAHHITLHQKPTSSSMRH
jgi:hypothetical protein